MCNAARAVNHYAQNRKWTWWLGEAPWPKKCNLDDRLIMPGLRHFHGKSSQSSVPQQPFRPQSGRNLLARFLSIRRGSTSFQAFWQGFKFQVLQNQDAERSEKCQGFASANQRQGPPMGGRAPAPCNAAVGRSSRPTALHSQDTTDTEARQRT